MAYVKVFALTTNEDDCFTFTGVDMDEDSYASYWFADWCDTQEEPQVIAKQFVESLYCPDGTISINKSDIGLWYITFTQDAVDYYFRRLYHRFTEALSELNGATEADMQTFEIPGYSHLQNALEDRYGARVYSLENGWNTIPDFMRMVVPEQKYYVCGAVGAYC